jgi:hypothetical protein
VVQVGNTVVANLAATLSSGASLAYQWFRDSEPIVGAAGQSYRITAGDFGRTIAVRVTVVGGASAGTSVTSAAYMPSPGRLTVAGAPLVEGIVAVGGVVTAQVGAWGPGEVALTFAWLRDGVAIPGAVGATYVLTPADAGHSITVRVSGSAPGFEAEVATSAAFSPAPVAAETAVLKLKVAKPKLKGTVKVGRTLKVVRGTWTAGTKFTYQWMRDGKAIRKATKVTYKLVKADAGKRISVKVTGTKAGYEPASSTSAKTKKTRK